MRRSASRARAAATTGLLALALLASAAAAAQAPREPAASAPSLVWKLERTTVNPSKYPVPEGSTVIARSGSLTWQILTAPQVLWTVTYPEPAKQLTPSQKFEVPVTASGRVTGGQDVGGYRNLGVIGYLDDRWVTNGPGLWQNCTAKSWNAPVTCDAPATARATIALFAPQPSRAGETFSWGVGALNCTACAVRFEYVAKAAAPKPVPVTMGSARLRMKAEAVKGAAGLFSSYVQTFAGADVEFSRRTGNAFGHVVIQHEFSLTSIPDWKLVLDVEDMELYAQRGPKTSVQFRVTVRTSTLRSCRFRSPGRIVLTDGGGNDPDVTAVMVCDTLLKFVHRKPDPVDRVTVTIRRPG